MAKEKKAKPAFDANSVKPVVIAQAEKPYTIPSDLLDTGEDAREASDKAWARQACPNMFWPLQI